MSVQTLPDFYELWDFQDPAKTEARFRELVPVAESEGDAAYLGELLTQVARTQGLQRQFVEAHATLDEVASRLRPGHPTVRVRLLLERGRVFNSSGDKTSAAPLFTEAYSLARLHKLDDLMVDAAHMVAIVETPEKALDWNELAIAAAEQSSDAKARRWLGSLYNNTAWAHHDLGEFEPAIILFEKALAFRREQDQEPETRIAKWCVARCHRSMGKIGLALAMQRELEAEHETLGERSGFVFEEIAECLKAQGKASESIPYFAKAYEELCKDTWLPHDQPERLARLKRLGGVVAHPA